MLRRQLFLGLMVLLVTAALFARVNAAVVGTVSDSTGALIPAVEITAGNVDTGISTMFY